MRIAYRFTVIGVVMCAVLLGSYDLASPYRVGMVGVDNAALPSGDVRVTAVYPNSAAARAGIRVGDTLGVDRDGLFERLRFYARRSGERLSVPVLRHGTWTSVSLVSTQYLSMKPIEEGPLAYFILLVFAVTASLIALRGHGSKEVRLLAFLLAFYALERAADWFVSTAPTAELALAATLLVVGTWAVVLSCELAFVAIFPPVRSALRTMIGRFGTPLVVAAAFVIIGSAFTAKAQALAGVINGVLAWGTWMEWTQALVYAVLVAGAIDALLHADVAHRAQTRWAASAIIVSTLPLLARSLYLGGGAINPAPFMAWVTLFSDVPLLAITYAVLRHRLVDLGVLMSRAAIFTTVSAVVVAMFIVAEWLGGNVLASALGEGARHGTAGQIFSAALALVLGLSVRSIHGVTEKYLNRVFFAGRERSLAELRRFAHEAEVITSAEDLFRLTHETVATNTESAYAAVYALQNGAYRACAGAAALPASFGVNDVVLVRLRRWNEPVEVDLSTHPLAEALVLPMTVRGTLLGVLCCGPKRERTHYLADETLTLQSVAHSVGAAYEYITRDAAPNGAERIRIS